MMKAFPDQSPEANIQDNISKIDLVDKTAIEQHCESSSENLEMFTKDRYNQARIRNIGICVVFMFSILSFGYWTGWKVAAKTTVSEMQYIEPSTTPKPIPTFGDLFEPAPSGRVNPSSPDKNPILVTRPPTKAPTNTPTGIPSYDPSNKPTSKPTNTPSETPSDIPSDDPSNAPTNQPTKMPTNEPIKVPSDVPTSRPTNEPSKKPTNIPTIYPTKGPTKVPNISYIPGNLTRLQNGLLLSEGLQARIIAETGDSVLYANGTYSDKIFHELPDAGAAFPDTRPWNIGGWIYVSNSESHEENEGGVGAITFDKHGSVIDYRMVLENTYYNCGGGRTPWNTWVSCEEIEFDGQIYQVDPTGQRPAQPMTLGRAGGRWESFAYDIRNKDKPHFFATEDHNKGTTRRFTPNVTHWGGDEWKMLHEEGVVDYLKIKFTQGSAGTFEWTDDFQAAKNNARSFFPQSEGIDIKDGKMYIVCKKIRQMFIFDLDQMTFKNMSTSSGLFDGDPDQVGRIVGGAGGLLYFTEEGGKDAGIHA